MAETRTELGADTRAAWEVVEEAAVDSSLYNGTVQSALDDLLSALSTPREPEVWMVEYRAFKGAPTRSYLERSEAAVTEFVEGARAANYPMVRAIPLYADPPPTDEDGPEGEEMRWTDEDEAELRDYQARVSCSGRYDQYEPTRHDHSRLAELKERKERATKAWVRQVEEYQPLSDSALEQVARYRAEQGGVNPDTAALLVLLCERWSRLRSRLHRSEDDG